MLEVMILGIILDIYPHYGEFTRNSCLDIERLNNPTPQVRSAWIVPGGFKVCTHPRTRDRLASEIVSTEAIETRVPCVQISESEHCRKSAYQCAGRSTPSAKRTQWLANVNKVGKAAGVLFA